MNVKLLNESRIRGWLQELRNETYPKLRFSMKINSVYITFHCEIECNLDFGVVGVNCPIEKCKQTRTIYGDVHVGGSKTGIYWRASMLNKHNNW